MSQQPPPGSGHKPDAVLPPGPAGKPSVEIAPAPPDPPVVARLVIEIRSDGSRTIARGAMEDVGQGTRVDLAVEADSPMGLLWKLVRRVGQTPALARRTVRGLLGGGRKK